MEERLDLILKKLERIEKHLFSIKDKTIEEFLSDNERENFIGINVNLIYEAYKNNTEGNASKRELAEAIKKYFGLRIKHTTKNKQNIYYWSE